MNFAKNYYSANNVIWQGITRRDTQRERSQNQSWTEGEWPQKMQRTLHRKSTSLKMKRCCCWSFRENGFLKSYSNISTKVFGMQKTCFGKSQKQFSRLQSAFQDFQQRLIFDLLKLVNHDHLKLIWPAWWANTKAPSCQKETLPNSFCWEFFGVNFKVWKKGCFCH